MALHESQIDAVSRVYAQSLFELADDAGGRATIEEIADELESILELTRSDKVFGEFLGSQIVSEDARGASLRTIFTGRVSDLTLNFLLILNEKNRLNRLGDIAAVYDHFLQERFGRVEVNVYTAAPIEADQLDSIKARLCSALGKEPVLHAYTEPAMLGGLKLQLGDQLIDASVATRLRKLHEQLSTTGSTRIHAAATRFFNEG